MTSPTDQDNYLDEPDTPPSLRHASDTRSRFVRVTDDTTGEEIGEIRLRSDADLSPVQDSSAARRSQMLRYIYLAGIYLAGSVVAVVAAVALSKLSPPGSIGAKQGDSLISASQFAGDAAKPERLRDAVGRAGEPQRVAPLADIAAPPPVEPAATAAAHTEPAPTADVATPGRAGPRLAATTLDANSDEIAALIERSSELVAMNNVAAARLILRRAAEARNARAALALGETYDPIVLKSLGIRGVRADAAAARRWYERAKEHGSAQALRRLETLNCGRAGTACNRPTGIPIRSRKPVNTDRRPSPPASGPAGSIERPKQQ